MPNKACFLAVALSAAIVGACTSAPEEETGSSATSPLVCGAAIGRGQCLVSVQNFYSRFGVQVGVAPGYGRTDAEGRWCAAEGACLLWVLDIPSRYGWVRTNSPRPFDIAVFPPRGSNPWGHVTVVDHVDGAGVWMIDSNDDGRESANNIPHLHDRAPYGYYHYTGASALGCGGAPPSSSPPASSAPSAGGASCAGYNDALYCGHNYVNGDASTLYRCAGGVAYVERACANGCTAAPNGYDDYCNDAPADPAPAPAPAPASASCAGYYDALYCGHNYVNGDPNTLYRCAGGVAYVERSCANGCVAAPDGANDYCR